MKDGFKFGTVSVPDGESGLWRVDTIVATPDSVLMNNLRALRNGTPEMVMEPGTYRRLLHKTRGVVMSNTRMEILTALEAYRNSTGRVLVNGLGLGMILEGILSKQDVEYVRVIELEEDVIKLVGPTFANDCRVEIIQADAYEYKPAKGEEFDYVWHDIWDTISTENLPDMTRLVRKYQRRAPMQGVWSRDLARREKRRWG